MVTELPEIENMLNFLSSPASFSTGPHGLNIQGPAFWVLPTELAFMVIFVGSLIWVFQDARKRNKSGFIALIFILLTGWPLSFVWWFWLRAPIRTRN